MPHDGIVAVPATRRAGSLATAVRLAAELDWPLLVLCSHGLRAPRLLAAARAHHLPGRLMAVDLPRSSVVRAARPFRTPHHPSTLRRRHVDTHRKRNLVLAVARLLRCELLLFVDDDIRGLTASAVSIAADALASPTSSAAAWAWPYEIYPDNSVVCHAGRDFGGVEQGVFPGGGAMLVDVRRVGSSFFPPVYNEDWLFLHDALEQRRVVADRHAGIRQLAYDPYAGPDRARGEEFGDVLAEGLFHLLHEGAPRGVAEDPAYWDGVRAERRRLIEDVRAAARLHLAQRPAPEGVRTHRALVALAAAGHELTRATSPLLASFVRDWRHDQQTWGGWLEALPLRDTLPEAFDYLGLPPGSWLTWRGPREAEEELSGPPPAGTGSG